LLIRIGTRGSKLSLVQTELLIGRLRETYPLVKAEIEIIKTLGDEDRRTPLFSFNQKGVFEREIDQAVLDGRIDFAVHSLKDIPVLDDKTGLCLAAFSERGSPYDALVSRDNRSIRELPAGSVVGTSSLLRVAQLKRVRPDLIARPIRGNVETRVGKVRRGEYEAVILAEAGLNRLGMAENIAERLPVDDFLPAPGQGVIAVVARGEDERVLRILSAVDHSPTRRVAEAERELVRFLETGCKVPMGALATAHGESLKMTAAIFSADGKERIMTTMAGRVSDPQELGRSIGDRLVSQGAKGLERGWDEFYKMAEI
jgi:hydroxymethylbilane synthase